MNTLDELITNMSAAPDKFNHLKIFLHREHTKYEPEFGRKFLFVAGNSFGLVKLQDIIVEDNHVNLVLEDVFMGQSGAFTIDINDKTNKFLMVAWEDVQDILYQDNNTSISNSELLEFEY